MTANTETAASLPHGLADVALIDAKTAAAAGAMSVSWWHEKVANGEAPQPAIRAPRCTRWKASEVRQFWIDFAKTGTDGADKLLASMKKATAASVAKKRANLSTVGA